MDTASQQHFHFGDDCFGMAGIMHAEMGIADDNAFQQIRTGAFVQSPRRVEIYVSWVLSAQSTQMGLKFIFIHERYPLAERNFCAGIISHY